MKNYFSVRDISRILGCCDQCVLNDIKKGMISGTREKSRINKAHYDGYWFTFSETACYINTKRRQWRIQ